MPQARVLRRRNAAAGSRRARPPWGVELPVEVGEQFLDLRLDIRDERETDAPAGLGELHADAASELLRELVGEAHLLAERLLLLPRERPGRRLVGLRRGIRLE